MTWNNRIMKRWAKEEGWYHSIHEVYYDRLGTPIMWTKEASAPGGCGVWEIKEAYEMQAEAFKKPVVDYETGVDETFMYMWM